MKGNIEDQSFDIDQLLTEAERNLANRSSDIGNAAKPNTKDAGKVQLSDDYTPHLHTGSVYDLYEDQMPAPVDSFILSDEEVGHVLQRPDVLDEELAGFLDAADVVKVDDGVAVRISSTSGQSIELIGVDKRNSPFADVDQILDFAVQQAALLREATSAAPGDGNSLQRDGAAVLENLTSDIVPVPSAEGAATRVGAEATLKVVSDSWEALRAVDVDRLVETAWNVGDDHLCDLAQELLQRRPELMSDLAKAFGERASELEPYTREFLLALVQPQGQGPVEEKSNVDRSGGDAAAHEDIPLALELEKTNAESGKLGIIALTENDIFITRDGRELPRYPKTYVKPSTTASKRIAWFEEQLAADGSSGVTEVLQSIRVLKENAVENFERIYQAACLKLFGSELGAPAECRKKTSQELQEEKLQAERKARDERINRAKARMKSPEDVARILAERDRVASILEGVLEAPTTSLDDLIGKPAGLDREPIRDKRMASFARSRDSEIPAVTQEHRDAREQQHANSYFAIVRDGERLAMGRGQLLTVSQINDIASQEGAVVIWAPNEATLDATISALGNAKHHATEASRSLEHGNTDFAGSTSSTPPGETKKIHLSANEIAHEDKFEAEVTKAVRLFEQELATHSRYQTTERKAGELRAVAAAKVSTTNITAASSSDINSGWELVGEGAKSKINVIVESYKARPELRAKATCDFYVSLDPSSGRHVIGVPRNLQTQQVKFYSISSSGEQVVDPEMTKLKLASLIAKGHLRILDVGISEPESRSTDSANMDEKKPAIQSLGMS